MNNCWLWIPNLVQSEFVVLSRLFMCGPIFERTFCSETMKMIKMVKSLFYSSPTVCGYLNESGFQFRKYYLINFWLIFLFVSFRGFFGSTPPLPSNISNSVQGKSACSASFVKNYGCLDRFVSFSFFSAFASGGCDAPRLRMRTSNSWLELHTECGNRQFFMAANDGKLSHTFEFFIPSPDLAWHLH